MNYEEIDNELINFLILKILAAALAGVHKKTIFDAFQPIIRTAHINKAIKLATDKGMYSIPKKHDEKLGVYYRVDKEDIQGFVSF